MGASLIPLLKYVEGRDRARREFEARKKNSSKELPALYVRIRREGRTAKIAAAPNTPLIAITFQAGS